MKAKGCLVGVAFSWALIIFLSAGASAQVNVLTYHYDNTRQGANLNETFLTPANVNSASFGQLFNYAVDGSVYAQPLYVFGLTIPNQGTHNVVFVATEHNSVYAFDADINAGANAGLLWQVNLGPSAPTPNPTLPFQIIQPEVGITGTPVIDLPSGTLYVDAFTLESGNYIHRIHALNLADGSEKPFSPVIVNASVPGIGAGSTNGVLPFQAQQLLQRSALTLANGILYVAYAGYTDTPVEDPFHGWIVGFDASDLQQLPNYVFCSTPNGTTRDYGSTAGEGGIWGGGAGLAVDGNGNLYFGTGDGSFNAFPNTNGTEYGNSIMNLSTAGGLSVADYFTSYNQAYYRTNDLDIGSGGVMLLPDQPGPYPHLLIEGGKPQRAYLINRDMMTSDNNHINKTDQQDNIVQTVSLGGGSFSTPAYFNGQIYHIAAKDVVRSYVLSNGTLLHDLPGTVGTRTFGFPGATPFITANGANNGIVWAIQKANPAVLVAYNATNLSTELYNSVQAGSRDKLPNGITFATPIAANGRVYVGSQGSLSVFGLLNSNSNPPPPPPPPNWQPIAATYSGLFSQSNAVAVGSSGAVTITTTARGDYSGKLQFAANNYSFHGKFNSTGAGSSTISQKSSGGMTVSLQANTADNSSISGAVGNGSWSANLLANQNFTKTRNNPSPFTGNYSLSLPGPGDGNPNNPQSNGSGTLNVNSSGAVKFKGVLGDSTKITESGNLSQSGQWPLFISLYHQQGEIIGWFNFSGNAISGTTTWIKQPNGKNKDFPNGFDLDSNATGSAQ
jgi:hypothetical protein